MLTIQPKAVVDDLAHFFQNGFAVARGLLSPAEVAEIRETFMELAKDGPVEGLSEMRKYAGGYEPTDPLAKYPRMMHPHRHPELSVGPLSLRYMLDARIEAVLTQLLEDEPIAAQTMFYFKPPGARGQSLHQDNYYLRVRPKTCMAAWIAIDPADEENGGMVVVPGSHVLDIACPETADSTISFTNDFVAVPEGYQEHAVRLNAGDVMFFNGSVIHGSYPNSSKDRFRRSFICHYVPASCLEVSKGYRPLLRFDGTEVTKEQATGGGPCGTAPEFMAPH